MTYFWINFQYTLGPDMSKYYCLIFPNVCCHKHSNQLSNFPWKISARIVLEWKSENANTECVVGWVKTLVLWRRCLIFWKQDKSTALLEICHESVRLISVGGNTCDPQCSIIPPMDNCHSTRYTGAFQNTFSIGISFQSPGICCWLVCYILFLHS